MSFAVILSEFSAALCHPAFFIKKTAKRHSRISLDGSENLLLLGIRLEHTTHTHIIEKEKEKYIGMTKMNSLEIGSRRWSVNDRRFFIFF
jgi:hypothetical protein